MYNLNNYCERGTLQRETAERKFQAPILSLEENAVVRLQVLAFYKQSFRLQ